MNLSYLPSKAYLIGIGGSGMYPLAQVLAKVGVDVKGSDKSINPYIAGQLAKLQVAVYSSHQLENLHQFSNESLPEVLIYSGAVARHNPLVEYALVQGVACFTRAEFLSLMSRHIPSVGVAGSHGKTTTSGILFRIFKESSLPVIPVIWSS